MSDHYIYLSPSSFPTSFVMSFAFFCKNTAKTQRIAFYSPRVETRGYQYLTPMGYILKIKLLLFGKLFIINGLLVELTLKKKQAINFLNACF